MNRRLMQCSLTAPTMLIGLFCSSVLAEFPGWQALRVVKQEGRPYVLRAGDLDGDGRQELVVVNQRLSRLEAYHWLTMEEREAAAKSRGSDRANDLPMAYDLRREEIQLEQLPQDLIFEDLDGDMRPELIVLVAPTHRVVVYAHHEQQGWQPQYERHLLEASIPSRRRAMLVRQRKDGKLDLLISCSNGIQQLPLHSEGRPQWLKPREQRDRTDWWLADLDGDGDEDLVEQTREANEAVRWYPCSDNGDLLPAQVIFDRAVEGVEVLPGGEAAELVLLESSMQGILRRYKLARGSESPVGSQHALALIGGRNAAWCGMQQGDAVALVTADPDRPRILSYVLAEEGWQTEVSFPSIGNVLSMAAPIASPGTLLIRVKDSADLYTSNWNRQRLTYPKPWRNSTDSEDREILGLGQVGSVTWWTQRVGKDLDLYRWDQGEDEASRQRFSNVATKADQVAWIGGDRLLVKDTHSRGLRLVTIKDDEAASTSPTHLQRADLAEFQLFAAGDEFQLGRFVEGVLQWLDDELQPYEQIMLPDGQSLAAFVPQGDKGGWGLQQDASFVHRLAKDEAGVVRSTERFELPECAAIVENPYLGLILVSHQRLTRLAPGRPWELDLVGMIDQEVGREGGVRETRFHRIDSTDLDGNGDRELVLLDDLEHRLTVLKPSDGFTTPAISWQVFDDKIYPYSDETENLVREPRAICSLDFDGDQHQDLALLCHDRLLIYLGHGE